MTHSAPTSACSYSAACEPCGTCTCSGYSITAGGLFGAAFSLAMCSHKEAVVYSNNSSPKSTAIPCTPSMPITSFSSVSRRRPSGLVRTSASCRPVSTNLITTCPPSTVPEEVELHIDVFGPVVQNWILREGDGGLVIHHQCWWVSFRTGQLAQQMAQPHNLARRCGRRYVFCLARR